MRRAVVTNCVQVFTAAVCAFIACGVPAGRALCRFHNKPMVAKTATFTGLPRSRRAPFVSFSFCSPGQGGRRAKRQLCITRIKYGKYVFAYSFIAWSNK
jgi:hypothetical protein